MFSSKKVMLTFGMWGITGIILAACAQPTPETIVETVVVTEVITEEGEVVEKEVIRVVTATPESVLDGKRTLVICLGREPDTLYRYGGDTMASSPVLQAVYDGPIESNSFGYQPVILEKLPSLADGDAVLNAVTVSEGDTVVDANFNVVTLEPGMMVIPTGESDATEYTGGEIQLDQLVATFKLLPGLTWSDGTPLTAADSVYSFDLEMDPNTPSETYVGMRTASYEAIDDLTVVWAGLPGYKDSEYFTNFWPPSPKHIWDHFIAVELLEAEESSRLPMGWGPYIIDEWVQGDHIRLRKNPNYWRADEGLPVFDDLVFRFMDENSYANIISILIGECDILDRNSGLDNQIELLLELQYSGLLNTTFVAGMEWEHVDFGIQHIDYDNGYDGGISDRPSFFGDSRTRQAFLMCMDRQAVIDNIWYGQSIVPDTYLPPQHPLFNPDASHYEFDVAAGSALLEQVGWVDDDNDTSTPRVASGVTGVPDGTELRIAFNTTSDTWRVMLTQILTQSLSECGIKAEPEYYLKSEWFAGGPEGKLWGRRFDLGEFSWLTSGKHPWLISFDPPCELYLSDNIPGSLDGTWIPIMDPVAGPLTILTGWDGQNVSGFYNLEYDAACKQAKASLPIQPAYEESNLEAQRLFAELLPVAPIAFRPKVAATRPDMCNFIMDLTANSEMWNIEEFDYGECAE